MATKTAFTAEEWQTLQWSVTDTMAYIAMVDPGFWDQFKEASAAAKFITNARAASTSELVRELAGDIHITRDKAATANPADVAGGVTDRVSAASKIVAEKAADDLDEYKAFIVGIAQATAEAAKGVDPSESEAIEKIKSALG